MIQSKINSILTLEYMVNEPEGKYFDRKSVQVKVADLASLISAFANADGGTIVIGISDKDRTIEGINAAGETKINDLINAPKDGCRPMPKYKTEIINVTNSEGLSDRILLIHIEPSINQIVRTQNDSTYLRIGDRTRELKGEDLKNLEFTKNSRHFEDEFTLGATIEDLDLELINKYKQRIMAEELSVEQVLRARGFIKEIDGEDYLTNGAVLLFAKNIRQFYPNCRIRFLRYDGNYEKTGVKMNIVKDIDIDLPILKILDKATEVISAQLREFTSLNPDTGKFQTIPEYPEFSWTEGIVNAVVHRKYDMAGSYIKVSMFDDRLEILSPGELPNIVTVDNIQDTRFARNPEISRVLTEFGWVRELNEGVKRIYSDMEDFFLDDPTYIDKNGHVRLILRNNIMTRRKRQAERHEEKLSPDIWASLDELEKSILTYMGTKTTTTRLELEKYTHKSARTITTRLNGLMDKGIIKRNGKQYDPLQTYEII